MKDKPLGIKIFGIGNIITGLVLSMSSVIFFYAAIFYAWIGERQPYGVIEWLCTVFIIRLGIIMLFVFSFHMIRSGIALLIIDTKARKISKVASTIVSLSLLMVFFSWFILSCVYPEHMQGGFNFLDFTAVLLIFYLVCLNVYLNRAPIKELFADQNIKISFIRSILIIIISFVLPFILNLFFPNMFFPVFGLFGPR